MQPKWRKNSTILFLVISIAFILTTILYSTFLPKPFYDRNSLRLKNEQVSCGSTQLVFKEKEFCLTSNLDYAQYDVSICRIFTEGSYDKYLCYKHYPNTLETWMYKLKTEVSVFLSLIVIMMIGSLILKNRIFGWGIVAGFLYSFLANVFLPGELPNYLKPPYRTFWILIPSIIGGIFGVIIHYYLRKNDSIEK